MDDKDKADKKNNAYRYKNFSKAGAQVAALVSPPKPGELKLDAITGAADDGTDGAGANKKDRRRNPLTVRLSDQERELIKTKAEIANCSVNTYVKAAALGSDYKPPTNPELVKALLNLNRELTAQGNNLNQIAYHLNSGQSSAAEGVSLLSIISRSLLQTHQKVRDALSWGKTPEP